MLDAPARLVAVTVPTDLRDAVAFLRGGLGARWLVEDPDGTAYAGLGEVARVTAEGIERFSEAERDVQALAARLDRPGALRLLGGFAFRDAGSAWDGFPSLLLVLPRLLLTVRPGAATLTAFVERLEDADAALAEARAVSPSGPAPTPSFGDDADERAAWIAAAADTVAAIRRGEAEKVVLARVRTGRAFSPVAPTEALAAAPGAWRFLVEPVAGAAFVGATPELLVAVRGRDARTAAVAGSAARGASREEETRLGDDMLRDPKERHEHELVVDAIRRSLTGLADEIRIAGSPATLAAGPVQHLSTAVDARVLAGVGALRLAAALHPTPAVGGHPTAAALALISDAETFDRGWYAGGVGWVGADGDGTFLVALRSALLVGDEVRCFAGAGIVAESDPAREWAETELKMGAVLSALGVGPGSVAAAEPAGGRAVP